MFVIMVDEEMQTIVSLDKKGATVIILDKNSLNQQYYLQDKFVPVTLTTKTFMLLNNWIMNITSFTASNSATQLASELEKVMLLCTFYLQETNIQLCA